MVRDGRYHHEMCNRISLKRSRLPPFDAINEYLLGENVNDMINVPTREYDQRAGEDELPEHKGMGTHCMIPRHNRQMNGMVHGSKLSEN